MAPKPLPPLLLDPIVASTAWIGISGLSAQHVGVWIGAWPAGAQPNGPPQLVVATKPGQTALHLQQSAVALMTPGLQAIAAQADHVADLHPGAGVEFELWSGDTTGGFKATCVCTPDVSQLTPWTFVPGQRVRARVVRSAACAGVPATDASGLDKGPWSEMAQVVAVKPEDVVPELLPALVQGHRSIHVDNLWPGASVYVSIDPAGKITPKAQQ